MAGTSAGKRTGFLMSTESCAFYFNPGTSLIQESCSHCEPMRRYCPNLVGGLSCQVLDDISVEPCFSLINRHTQVFEPSMSATEYPGSRWLIIHIRNTSGLLWSRTLHVFVMGGPELWTVGLH